MKPFAARLADLSEFERAIVAERVEQIRSRGGYAVRRRASRREAPAASFAQERLWFVDALNPGHGAYNITASLRFDGPLNVRAIADSLKFVVERHETLRTTFSHEGDELRQVVRPAAAVALPLIDLSRLDAAERDRQIEHAMSRELDEGFDLARGPMLRAVLLKTSAQSHDLLLTTHHISSDGWSTGLLQREVMAAYDAYSRGATPSLADLPVQYADYAEWQRKRFRSGEWKPLIDFWKRELSGAPEVLQLPTCRHRPAHRTMDGKWINIDLPADLVAALTDMAREQRCTIFMILLAAYAVLLQRFSGQDDVVVGVPVANRGGVELEPLIGFFVNAVPMRMRGSRSGRFSDLLQQVRNSALLAYQHQELPFEKLVEEIEPERELRRNPVFQATFSLQNLPTLDTTEEADPDFRADRIRGSIKFDISLHLRHAGKRIVGSLGYATDLLDDDCGDLLASALQEILVKAARDPDTRVGELVPGAEPWAAACPLKPPEGGPAGRRFALPEHGVAAIDRDGATTWAEIERAADASRRALEKCGVAEGAAVVLAARSLTGWLKGAAAAMSAGLAVDPVEPCAAADRKDACVLIDGEVRPRRDPAPAATAVSGPDRICPDLLPLLDRLAARINLPQGALAALGDLTPVDSTMAALLAAAGSFGLTAPAEPSDAMALLDHATWEGASALIVGAGQARRIAETTYVPLDGLFALVVGGPLSPGAARLILQRGGHGIAISRGLAISPWLFFADLDAVAAGVTLGHPLLDLRAELRGGDGEPVPFGARGTLWGRSASGGDLQMLLHRPARRRFDGALEAEVEGDREATLHAIEAQAESLGPIAHSLCGIWEDVLGHPIGMDEDFFAAGGHSLRAAQVVGRMKELLRKPITIQKLFEERTIGRLSNYLAQGEDAPHVEQAARLLLEVSSLSVAEAEARLSATGTA